ncbi:MAG: SMP-30/gluconolactonase/LRE family protein [Caulobacterales bacterium]
MKIEKLNAPRSVVGEGPLWDQTEQALFFVDLIGKKLLRFDPETGDSRLWEMPDVIGSLALRAKGGALVALKNGVHALDFDGGRIEPFALLPKLDPSVQFNDGKVDRRGRFIVGTMDTAMKDKIGALYSLSPDSALQPLDDGYCITNGPCWSPDNRVLYAADTLPHEIYQYDYDPETGAAANRRIFAKTHALGGLPDGATVDADGLYWTAICEGGAVAAFRPDGKLERKIEMPVKLPTSVMFGGPNLDRLFVTSLDPSVFGRPSAPEDGCLFVIDGLGARGLPEPRFAG